MAYGEAMKRAIWEKAQQMSRFDPEEWRLDRAGRVIHWHAYDDRDSKYGWEIHRDPGIAGDIAEEMNFLKPLHWETRARLDSD